MAATTMEQEAQEADVDVAPKKWSYVMVNATLHLVPGALQRRPACGCLQGLWRRFFHGSDEEERVRFEQTVRFLRDVPLFRSQLPVAELPKLARDLKVKRWRPGQKLVQQEEVGRAFYLVQSGRAKVFVLDDEGKEHISATLIAGDYFGCHTLVADRVNIGTVVAQGPDDLVTLSMSKKVFEMSGLKDQLQFPKRPGLRFCDSPSREPSLEAVAGREKSPEEQVFLLRALKGNVNLRALHGVENRVMQSIANAAVLRRVPQGTVVADYGSVGQEFFIIKEGAFQAIAGATAGGSLEDRVNLLTMSERLQRKQHFFNSMNCRNSMPRPHSQSLCLEQAPKRLSPKQNASGEVFGYEGEQEQPKVAESLAKSLVMDLGKGDSFGELSLIYNTFREATFKAVEDSEVWVISRRDFKSHFNRRGRNFKEFLTLIDEVQVLSPLLQIERWELACTALGLFSFRPGERVITQGNQRKAALWYIIYSGGCVVRMRDAAGQERRVSELRRGGHFGERSLLRAVKSAVSEVSVDAGSDGMVCLAFEGQAMRDIFEMLIRNGALGSGAQALLPDVMLSSAEYEVAKASRRRTQSPEDIPVSRLRQVCMLGRGGFANVVLMEDNDTKKRYALKCLSKGHVEKQDAVRQVCWEREMMILVDSPFVIRLVQSWKDAEFVYILLEAALGGSLYELLRSQPEVFMDDQPRGASTAFFVGCIVEALEHLHERRIVYRDMKPENVMLDEQGYGKVCDMGFARFVIHKTNTLAGTPDYMAPEVIDFPHGHDWTCDWWSLGCLAFELISGNTPWDDDGVGCPYGRILAIRRSQEVGRVRYPFSCPLILKSFIGQLLQPLPTRLGARGGAEEVRRHLFFRKLDFDFEALKAHSLPAPLKPERNFKVRHAPAESDMEALRGELRRSPLFRPVCGENSWDEDF